MAATRVADIMTGNIAMVRADDTLESAAQRMAGENVGSLPVCDQEKHVRGMITDRDIVVGALARGKDPKKTTVGEIATKQLVSVTSNDPINRAAELMAEHRVRRLPVIDNDRIVGIVSQSDIAHAVPPERTGKMVSEISEG